MATVSCSVIVTNWNGRSDLEGCLPTLREQTHQDFEVIVVDNGSTDGSLELLEAEFPEVRVIPLGENRGFATANNIGIREARGDYVALLNNDTEVDPLWLAELVASLERHPAAASVTSKMLLFDQPDTIDGAGDVLNWLFLPYPRGHRGPDRGQYEDEVEVFSASGGAALWRGDVLRELGAFDEAFFIYYEDVDLGFRARLRGYECWYVPTSVVLHRRGAATKGLTEFELFHPLKNRWFMILKNTPARLFIRHLPHIVFGDVHWAHRAVTNRRTRAALRAYAAVVRALPRLLRQRRKIQRTRRLAVEELNRLLKVGGPDYGGAE
jgi:GT2 family glycosyltransferase